MQIIRNWLAGTQSFASGVILYKSFGTNKPFIALLDKGETVFAKNLLIEELKALAENGVEPVEEVIDAEGDEMPVGDGDDILTALEQEWRPLYQEMNLLRHKLDKYGADNSDEAIAYRKPIAAKIKQLEKKCMAIWSKRDYYIENDKLPYVPDRKLEIPTDPLELAGKINNCKKYIRRYRQMMNKYPQESRYVQFYQDFKQQHKQLTGKEYEKN